MNETLTVLNIVWPYLVAGGGITVVTQILKRITRLENSAVILTLFHTVTLLTTAVAYLLSTHALSAGTLALHAAGFSGIANALYPLVARADAFLTKLNQALKIVKDGTPKVEAAINEATQTLPPPATF